ncbi:MAG: histidine--tRNA ligase [Rickettsiaceae bacterium]
MKDELKLVRGTKDLLPDDFKLHNLIIRTAASISKLYSYKEMSVPLIEYIGVFQRTMGESSDVISKEIYSFPDRSGNMIALRPEFTAGVMRAVLTNHLNHSLPLRLFSHGPVFRYDRPQAGRQRQFHQLNFELIGLDKANYDAEIIKLGYDIIRALGIGYDSFRLEINSLGCFASRSSYTEALKQYLLRYESHLSQDSLKRLSTNPLRILDSKDQNDQEILLGAPLISDYHTDESRSYFNDVLKYLEMLGIRYIVNDKLVRGLDYYCNTIFEFTTTKIGAQSALIAGGRYDGLSKTMGYKQDIPAIGFAAGIERLALMMDSSLADQENCDAVLIFPIEQNNIAHSLILANKLRAEEIASLLDVDGKISKRMTKAMNTSKYSYVVFIGEQEEKLNTYKLKDLRTRQEHFLPLDELIKFIKS